MAHKLYILPRFYILDFAKVEKLDSVTVEFSVMNGIGCKADKYCEQICFPNGIHCLSL